MAKKQKIKCDVDACKFQNDQECVCELDEITVSCNCGCDNSDVSDQDETRCASFECKKNCDREHD